MIKYILKINSQIVCRYPVRVIIVAVILSFLLLIPALKLKGNFNILNLLPQTSPEVKQLHRLFKDFGGDDRLLIAVERTEQCGEEMSVRFIDRLLATIKSEDEQQDTRFFKNLDFTASQEDKEALIRFLFENGFLFLNDEGVDRFIQRVSKEGIERAVKKSRILIRSGSIVDKKRVKKDPLNLSQILLSSIPKHFKGAKETYYRRSPDGSLFLVALQPVKLPQDGEFSRKLLEFCRTCVEKTTSEFSDPVPGVTFTGGYAIADSDTRRIISIIRKTFIASLVIVTIMLFVAFKEIRILFLIVPCLATAILWTAGIAQLIFKEITVMSAAFAAILIGLGVDFAIHIYNRFRIEISSGHSIEKAMEITHTETGFGIVQGAVTTAAAFFVLALSDFKGMREFGILVGSGVLLSAVICFTVFSAVLYCMAKRGFKKTFTREFGLGFIYDTIRNRQTFVLVVFTIITAGSLLYTFSGKKLSFENDPRNLRPADDPVMKSNELFAEKMGGSLVQFPVIVNASSLAELLDKSHVVALGLKKLKNEGFIPDYVSPGDYFTTMDQQKNNIKKLVTVDFGEVEAMLQKELKKNGFKPQAFSDTFTSLRAIEKRVGEGRVLQEEDLCLPFIKKIVSRFFKIDPHEQVYSSLSVFYTQPGRERDFDVAKVGQAVHVNEDEVFITGVNIINRVVINKMSKWMRWIFPLILIVIELILYINFRSLRFSLMASIPLMIGISLLLGTMKVMNVKFNVMNFGIIPMIIGIGVDNGIHIIRGYLDSPEHSVRESLSVCGRAVIMTSLTTIAGFGSLVLGEYRGIISMGILAGFGVGYCLIATVFVLPVALIKWGDLKDS